VSVAVVFEFACELVVSTDAGGDRSRLTIAHPGEYRVGDRRVTVPEQAVVEGETVRLGPGRGTARRRLNEDRVAYAGFVERLVSSNGVSGEASTAAGAP
jgi:hypothetical protein